MKPNKLLQTVFLLAVLITALAAQTFQDGINMYKKAYISGSTTAGHKDEKKALQEAYRIFKDLASADHPQALVMYYLMSLKLRQPFTLAPALDRYVKDEHPTYPTVERIKFFNKDKALLLENLKGVAEKNKEKARLLLEEAKGELKQNQYSKALAILKRVEMLWKEPGLSDLKMEYLKREHKYREKLLIARLKELVQRHLYKEALETLAGSGELLDRDYAASFKGKIKSEWYTELFTQARIEYRNKQYARAIQKCDEAYAVSANSEVLRFKRKCQKKMKGEYRTGLALFVDTAITGALKMDEMNYSWSGNSKNYLTLTDYGTVSAELIRKDRNNKDKLSNAFSGGFVVLFSPSFGISASISSFSKQEFNVTSQYNYRWDSTSWNSLDDSGNMNYRDTGTMSVTPINLNLVLVLRGNRSLALNLYGGATLFLTKVDFTTLIGYSHRGSSKTDFFPFQYQISQEQTLYGWNVGADLEVGGKGSAAYYFGFQYFSAPPQEYQWEIIESAYYGVLGRLGRHYSSSFTSLPNYTSTFNFSTYKVHFGIKLYF